MSGGRRSAPRRTTSRPKPHTHALSTSPSHTRTHTHARTLSLSPSHTHARTHTRTHARTHTAPQLTHTHASKLSVRWEMGWRAWPCPLPHSSAMGALLRAISGRLCRGAVSVNPLAALGLRPAAAREGARGGGRAHGGSGAVPAHQAALRRHRGGVPAAVAASRN